ncbi:processing of GAS1 and ALP protein 2 [[Candida] railenensis]|uniref:Processing of GAS1 and ALP protein 2 n=1 Tax=[Candida] railenensis TaxID=45579 RepID=A0A9P0QR78_9ASCO|nr:processing of GAS1 and ALP protein 2 [[Candida] railenensis]
MFEFIYDYVEKDTFTKYLRLVIFVAAYVIFRNYYSEWAKMKQVKRQIALDEQEKLDKPEKERKEKEAQAAKLKAEAATFGWGKKTRKNVKLVERELAESATTLRERHQTSYDAQEDHDIEDLLED